MPSNGRRSTTPKALRLDHLIGSLTPGKQADLIMIKRDALQLVSSQDPVQTVVSYAQTADVDMVMIAGRIVKENGNCGSAAWTTVATNCGRRPTACWPMPASAQARTGNAV